MAAGSPDPHSQREEPRWRSARSRPVRGVALVVHGLNMRPSALDPFCEFLADMGLHSYRMTLTGHNEAKNGVFSEAVWVDDVQKAYSQVRAEFPELPTYIVGYSLGGLLVTHAVDELPEQQRPRAMVLLAPALSLRALLDVLTFAGLPPAHFWSVPNIAPDPYRRYPTTPLFWYSNTLTLYEETDTLKHAGMLRTLPTLIVVNPEDELVSESGLREWIRHNDLAPHWRVFEVHTDPNAPHLAEHIIVDERSLGPTEWGRMTEAIRDFMTNEGGLGR